VCNAVNSLSPSFALSDGAGWAYVAWYDIRLGGLSPHRFVQNVSPTGAALWAANGQQL